MYVGEGKGMCVIQLENMMIDVEIGLESEIWMHANSLLNCSCTRTLLTRVTA